jgi:FAD/FMN-containing dehydrogenase
MTPKALFGTSGAEIPAKDVAELTRGLAGSALGPDDAGYDEARRLWNGMIDRRPGLIVRCAGADDVARCVDFARDHDVLLAVRGGGHSFPGFSMCDGGLVIDLSGLRGIQVDATSRTARVEAGATWAEVDAATYAHGLAVTGGQISNTGVAGLTLGGGIGWLARPFGLTSDSLLSVDIVTADGQQRKASDSDSPDLFWGLRGGGGNFGVVTSFEFRLHPLSDPVLGGQLAYPLRSAGEALRFIRQFAAEAPDALTLTPAFLHTPDGQQAFGIALCYAGPPEEGEQAIKPLREYGPPVEDMVGPMTYLAVQSMLDPATPPGLRYYMRSYLLDEISDGVIDTVVEAFPRVPSSRSLVVLPQVGGAIGQLPDDASAYRHRRAAFSFTGFSIWDDPAQDEPNVAWARQLGDAVAPYSSGVYVNELSDEGEDRVRAAYGAETYGRLAALKRTYDPTNLFRLNQNIKPG